MDLKRNGGPAFPSALPVQWPPHIFKDGDVPHPKREVSYACFTGLTKREAFAMAAMQGILGGLPPDLDYNEIETAKMAVKHADALLAELAKEVAHD